MARPAKSLGAGVENGDVFSARLVAERAGEPTLAQAARPGQEQITALGDPVASGELEEERGRSQEGSDILNVRPMEEMDRGDRAHSNPEQGF